MNRYVEVFLSYLLRSSRGHDSKAFYTLPAFASHPRQTITVTSPDCGPSPASLAAEYVHEGGGRIPGLAWTAPSHVEGEVKEWLIVSEDPDAPLPTPICHGVYGGIPASRRHVKAEDFEIADAARSLLKGGFHWGKGRREGVYVPPRPLMNHGPHRWR
ncbi:hypothetical protein C8034_v006672 [Colletotrichum sidae]|uniref:Uncharacterized protein n=3 Tax=Colletotrichum orbiculare species complex TaxID=2707354 RepID=A0A4R8RYU2_COLTR|nr:hypothetical protein C8035_v007316 [Colletotrichum spinosum]TDZ71859.1 hypothetical protein CTRI78_v001750 [Colletotrichum trifolii]TDZ87544.1 hypothetical protein C8034_v006672 [Colletotrichum sidae]